MALGLDTWTGWDLESKIKIPTNISDAGFEQDKKHNVLYAASCFAHYANQQYKFNYGKSTVFFRFFEARSGICCKFKRSEVGHQALKLD